ncbi:hypothetical protein CTAYLR_004065 [Chrysophaeum taylorii]|uniref:Sulfatase N-terminal domain-containing protein n=1 Tax=Chrysophaeum taylorii TaxID=2483200 RepID=A0AAD7UNG5_9STRA|nr:hypothetical protein CTAYLR_004065 [Chrysophaeum taylorii]
MEVVWLFVGWAAVAAQTPKKPPAPPNIVMILADDLGWGDVGFHNSTVATPTMDRLVAEGVELNRHYAHYYCTPSRASLQSGRLPVHLLLALPGPCDRNGAIPYNMTGVAEKLKFAGYETHQVGKWDAGLVTPKHTPHGRGYDTSLSYFGHGNWAWTQKEWGGSETNSTSLPDLSSSSITDLWDTDRPAFELNGSKHEEYLFRDRMLSVIAKATKPLFLQYDSKLAHYPLQAPEEYQREPGVVPDNTRVYHGMVRFLDDQLAAIVGALEPVWNSTLVVFSADNGGFVEAADGPCNTTRRGSGEVGHGTACVNGEFGASNYPLRGGKNSAWEGGIRTVAFASGGFLPLSARGSKLDAIVHVADWYATFCALAGVSPVDNVYPPIDSVNAWPLIIGDATEARASFLVDRDAYVRGPWKYIAPNTTLVDDARGGPVYPNMTSFDDPISTYSRVCGARGCLFNVVDDPFEEHDVVDDNADLVDDLRAELAVQVEAIFTVDHSDDPACLTAARDLYGGFYGPWKDANGKPVRTPRRQ